MRFQKGALVHKLLLVMVILAAATTANAQTTANGPYYAWPSWDQTLPSSTRFIVLANFSSAAVMDRETGLVWEKSPDSTTRFWLDAQTHCNRLTVGTRKGWRLPTIQELTSLMDASVAVPGPVLPAGHPFGNVQNFYWSATTNASNTLLAWGAFFNSGFTDRIFSKSSVVGAVWCVRGGQGVDPQ